MSTNSEECNFSMIKYCMSISEGHWAGLTPRYRVPLLRVLVSAREEIFLQWIRGRRPGSGRGLKVRDEPCRGEPSTQAPVARVSISLIQRGLHRRPVDLSGWLFFDVLPGTWL